MAWDPLCSWKKIIDTVDIADTSEEPLKDFVT